MTEPVTDQELLREFASRRSETAFAALVERHLNLVYGVAFRALGETAAAQDVTQEVFVTLARKAVWLGSEVSLAGWLHRTARFKARHWWRTEARRRQREETATQTSLAMKDDDSLLKSLAGVLDEGLLTLPERERQAVILRFMEERSHREVGARLGIGEDAARKRAEKGLNQLTAFFRRRGYAVTGTAATVTALRASLPAAPGGLASGVVQAALVAGGGVPITGLGLLLLKFMALTKTQTAVVCLVLAAGPLAWQANHILTAQREAAGLEARRQTVAARLASQREEEADVGQKLKGLGQSLETIRALAARRQSLAKSSPKDDDPALYRWSDDSPYVRLPKAMFERLQLYDAAMDYWGRTEPGKYPRISQLFTRRGEISAVNLEALGLNAEQRDAVRSAYADFVREYNRLELAHSRLVHELPNGKSTGEFPALDVEAFPAEAAALKGELDSRLEQAGGAERARLLLKWLGRSQTMADWFSGAARLYKLVAIPHPGYAMIESNGEMGPTGGVLIEDLPERLREYVRNQLQIQNAWKTKTP